MNKDEAIDIILQRLERLEDLALELRTQDPEIWTTQPDKRDFAWALIKNQVEGIEETLSLLTESQPSPPETDLPALPVARESMEPGKLYLWNVESRYIPVQLNPAGDGFEDLTEDFGGHDNWFFDDELIGCLYGPLPLAAPAPSESSTSSDSP